MRPFLDARRGHQQASDDRRAEIPGGGDEAARDAADGHEALRQAARVRLDGDRHHPAAHEHGHQRMRALVDPRGEELERIEEELRPRREADDQRNRDRHPQPIADGTPREGEPRTRQARSLLLPRLERAAELVGERSEPLRRQPHPRARCIRALPSASCASRTALALRRMRRPAASTSRTTTSTSAPTGNALSDIRFLRHAGFAQRDEAGASRGEEHEHAELLVTLDLAREARARHDLQVAMTRAAGARRALRHERDADPLLLEIDAQDLERRRSFRRDRAVTIPRDRPVGANVDACASPSTPGSSSTNAPNSATRVTRPVRTWPTSYVS